MSKGGRTSSLRPHSNLEITIGPYKICAASIVLYLVTTVLALWCGRGLTEYSLKLSLVRGRSEWPLYGLDHKYRHNYWLKLNPKQSTVKYYFPKTDEVEFPSP